MGGATCELCKSKYPFLKVNRKGYCNFEVNLHNFMKINWFLGCVLTFFVACQSNSNSQDNSKTNDSIPESTEAKKTVTVHSNIPVNQTWDRFCTLLSGDTSELKSDTKNGQIWKSYSRETNIKWSVLNNRVVKPISGWVNSSKLEIPNEPKTLIYPFAGGDFFYSHLFFPKQDTTIMIGLEPAGYLFNVDSANAESLTQYLKNLEHALFFPHRLGFFRTLSMEVDFSKGYLNGTIHTALYYMAKFGYKIHYIKSFDIDKTGKVVQETDMGYKNHHQKAVKIGFSNPGENSAIKEWIYISADLSDLGLSGKSEGVYNYLDNRESCVSFFKAASYLMHNSYFSKIRNLMLKKSKRILQDDSGIPYINLKDNNFEVKLLGEYTKTIALFSTRVQENMKEDYAKQKPSKLPFNIGYNAEFNQCNLQSAVKK